MVGGGEVVGAPVVHPTPTHTHISTDTSTVQFSPFGTKGAIANAQQHAGVIGKFICGDDIKFTIAVHIAQGYGAWSITRCKASSNWYRSTLYER